LILELMDRFLGHPIGSRGLTEDSITIRGIVYRSRLLMGCWARGNAS